MSDIQLFRIQNNLASELTAAPVTRERDLQKLIEQHMETFLGVRFLATEYVTGKTHRGRIDSLGLDENNCPVIIEYKRHSNENVTNQGLFYLDWLLDHQAEFRWLVMEKLGKEAADKVEWDGTRLLCIAADFTRYDQYAVQQIPRNIELLRYKLFGEDLLLLELVNTQTVSKAITQTTVASSSPSVDSNISINKDKTFTEQFAAAKSEIQALYQDLRSFIMALGDDVTEKQPKLYVAFRKLKNFACVVMQRDQMLVTLALNPDTVALETDFSRNVRTIGHWGTGDLELKLRNTADLERAKPLLERAYQER